MNLDLENRTETTKKAIKAAKGNWGAYATFRYLQKHNIPYSLYTLARVLENYEKAIRKGKLIENF
jgi:hypothetical protein